MFGQEVIVKFHHHNNRVAVHWFDLGFLNLSIKKKKNIRFESFVDLTAKVLTETPSQLLGYRSLQLTIACRPNPADELRC